jgi:isoleucyl-tRNA synthetase
MGYWVDMEDPYVTHNQIHGNRLVDFETNQQGFDVQRLHHSAVFPKAGTGLSSHEVNQPGSYRDVTDTTL